MKDEMFYKLESGELDRFAAITQQVLSPDAVPLASGIEKNVPIYDMAVLRDHLDAPTRRRA